MNERRRFVVNTEFTGPFELQQVSLRTAAKLFDMRVRGTPAYFTWTPNPYDNGEGELLFWPVPGGLSQIPEEI